MEQIESRLTPLRQAIECELPGAMITIETEITGKGQNCIADKSLAADK